MIKFLLLLFVFSLSVFSLKADRIYVLNSNGYNTMEPQLQTAIANNGHTITVSTVVGVPSLPGGFTTTCIDPIAGYDYLCLFGTANFTPLLADIQLFIDDGGKVFYQYEVTCCTQSSASAAAIASGLTGLAITPDPSPYLALGNPQGWQAANLSCCGTFSGNAYKGMVGLPANNQLQATANLNGSMPSITLNTSFGFVFHTTDFLGTANSGGFIGLGDVNIWYDGSEPLSSGGNTPVNTTLVDYIFPNATSTCYLFPPGCLITSPSIAPNPNQLNVDLGPDTALCNGETLLLDVFSPGATYLWQDGSTNSSFTTTLPGTYSVVVTSSCGIGEDTIVVSSGIAPPLDLGNDTTICFSDSLVFDISSPGTSYMWHDGTTNPTYTLQAADTIWATATLGVCSTTDSLIVENIDVITVNLGNDTVVCDGNMITINLVEQGVTFLWQDGSSNAAINVTQTGTYWVDVTNVCGTTRDSIDISFTPLPPLNLGADTTLCQGETLILDVGSSNGIYLWQNNSTNQTLSISQPGTYWVDYTVNNCTRRDSTVINYNPLPIVNLGNDIVLCEGETVLIDAGNPTATFNWQDNTPNQTLLVTQAGNYKVDVTINNCTTTDSITVDYTPLPIVNLGADRSLCSSTTITLNANNFGSSYLWHDNSTNGEFVVTQEGIYFVEVTSNNCSASDTVMINYYEPLDLSISGDLLGCSGDTLRVLGNSGIPAGYIANWSWSFDDGSSGNGQNIANIYNSGGTYTIQLTGTSINNCTESITAVASITQSPEARFSFSPVKPFLGQEVQFTDLSDNAEIWEWSFGNGLNSILQEPTTTYEVNEVVEIIQKVTNGACSDIASQFITFSEELLFYVPNAFIPNGSSNTVFQPVFTSGFDPYNFQMTIFNRWGEIVFQSFDASAGWNGTFGNAIAQDDTYIWKISFLDINFDRVYTEFGTVTVLR